MDVTHQLFPRMSKRNIIINTLQSTTPRRCLRLLHQNNPPEPHDPKSRKNRVSSSDTPLSSIQNDPLKKPHKDCPQKLSKKSIGSDFRSKDHVNSSTGSRTSPRSNNLVDGFCTLRRSPRFSSGGNADDKQKKLLECVSNKFTKNKVSDRGKSSKCVSGKCKDNGILYDGGKGELGVDSSQRMVENKRRMTRSVVGLTNEAKSKEVLLDGVGVGLSEYRMKTRSSLVGPMSESGNVAGEKGKVSVHPCEQKRRTRGSDEGKSSKHLSGKCKGKGVLSDGGKGEFGVDSSRRRVETNRRRTTSMVNLMNESKCKKVLLDEVGVGLSEYRRRTRSFIGPMNEFTNVAGGKGKVGVHSCEQIRGTEGSIGSMNKGVLSDRGKGEVGPNLSERVVENCRSRTMNTIVGWMNGCINKEVSSDGKNGKVCADSCVRMVAKCDCKTRSCVRSEVVKGEGGERKEKDVCGRSEKVGFTRKRKRDEEGSGAFQGWTKEQDLALQRAYFAAEPTPHFWRKVSKLVPGKSAQDCFDKVHSDYITPPQPQPRSRANKINSSSVEHFSLSASKLLKPTELKIKRSSCNKQSRHRTQKTIRQLLEKHYHIDQDYEADLFSVLEPNTGSSSQALPNNILSTPKCLQEKQGFLPKFHERSSSDHKRPLSRFNSSCRTALVSPPVLKQVKNRALHEKYIDQLHCREAKRKTESAKEEKSISGKENRRPIHAQKMDVVRAAKNALVSDVRDAINQLQGLQTNTVNNSSDFDYDGVNSGDDEGEIDL